MNITELQTALQELAAVAQASHHNGDMAAKAARSAAHRRIERKWDSVNRASRATAQAIEATFWLADILMRGMDARGRALEDPARMNVMQQFVADADALADDLNFEAQTLLALEPERPAPRRRIIRGKP